MRLCKLATILLTIILLCGMLQLTIPPTVKADPATLYVPTLDYPTISVAITAASSGDTILVAAGTYNEELVIDKSLTITGAGADTTIIDGTTLTLTQSGLVTITAAGDVTLSGFTIRNAPIVPLSDDLRICVLTQSSVAGPTYTISYNKIYGSNDPNEYNDYGFYASYGKENIVFTHNLVTETSNNNIVCEVHTGSTEISHNTLDAGCWGTDAVFFMTYNGQDVNTLQNVSFNTIDMSTGGPFDYDHHASGITFASPAEWPYPPWNTLTPAKFTNMLISGNEINNLESYRRGIGFWIGGTGAELVSPIVTNNIINGLGNPDGSSGIDFVGNGIVTGATITGSTITGTKTAIELRSGDASGTTINYNNIAGNTVGLDWTDGSLADARFNWWGSATGPGPNPPGSGDPVTGNANTSPWLISPFEQERLYTSSDPVTKTYGDIGTDFTLYVNVANIVDLFSFDINITWDNSLITFKQVDYTGAFDALWGAGHWNVLTNKNGTGSYRIDVVAQSPAVGFTGSGTLFILTFHIVRGSNVAPLQTPIHFKTANLSNGVPTPIPATVDDGLYQISSNTPGLKFVLVDPNPAKLFEYGKMFNLQVYVTNVSSTLKSIDITVKWDTELFNYTKVFWLNSVLTGPPNPPTWVVNYAAGTVELMKTKTAGWIGGASGLLFTLNFTIKFDDRIEHIWRTNAPHDITRDFSFFDAKLTFAEGTLSLGGIAPGSLAVPVHLIKGDVTCDGMVDISDLQAVASHYDQSSPEKYDLTMDGTIDIFDLVVIGTNFWYGH